MTIDFIESIHVYVEYSHKFINDTYFELLLFYYILTDPRDFAHLRSLKRMKFCYDL